MTEAKKGRKVELNVKIIVWLKVKIIVEIKVKIIVTVNITLCDPFQPDHNR